MTCPPLERADLARQELGRYLPASVALLFPPGSLILTPAEAEHVLSHLRKHDCGNLRALALLAGKGQT